jgi:hypothetical protein
MTLVRTALALSLAVVTVAGCQATELATGVVVDIKTTPPLQVDRFTLRTQAGDLLEFRLGPLDVRNGFPASHLTEHMATSQPVAVAYRLEDGQRVAVRLADAPWADR